MTKVLNLNHLSERLTSRMLLATFLCTTLAALGCTTDRNLGNGDPVVTPGVRSAPTGATSSGSESEPLPPPMMSSFSNGSVEVQPQLAQLSAAEAAAIMAQHQPRVRVLGPVAPGPGLPYRPAQTFQQPSGEVRYSVNSTIYSRPTEAVVSGADESGSDAGAIFTDAVNNVTPTLAGATVASGTTGAVTPVTNAAAPVITPSANPVTPTSNAVATPTGFASVGTLSPTAAAVVNPPASISSSPTVAQTSSASAQTSSTRTAATTTTPTANATSNPVRVLSSNGRLTITNTGSTRQQ
jgi:hypothetical protein